MCEDFTIRVASEKDAPALLKIYAPYVRNTAVSFEYAVPAEEEFAGRIQRVLKRYPYLTAERNGELLGYIYVSAFKSRAAYDWAVETSIYVRGDRKRLGVGRALHGAMEKILRTQGVLNLNACIACPDGEDDRLTGDSAAFHKSLGYQTVGKFHRCGYKFGRWYDMVWMEKMIGDHVANQPAVKLFADVRAEVRENYGIV